MKKALALRGILLENLHGRRVDIHLVRATQLPCQVVRGHAIEHVVDLRGRCRVLVIVCFQRRLIYRRRAFINQHLAQPWRHRDRHFDVTRDLVGVVRVHVRAVKSVNQNIGQHEIGRQDIQGRFAFVVGIVTRQFKKPHRLSTAVLRNAGGISRAKVIAHIGTADTAPSTVASTGSSTQRTDLGLEQRARPVHLRTRRHIIVQTADRQHRRIQFHRRLNIRREESARLNRVLIDAHLDVKCLLNIRDRSADIEQSAVGMGRLDNQPVRLRESNHRLIVLLAGAKGGGELIRGQIVAKIGAGRLIKLLKQVCEFPAVPQRQADCQVQAPAALKPANGREPFGYRRHMASESLLRPLGRRREPQPARRHKSRCGGKAAWKRAPPRLPRNAERKSRQGGAKPAQSRKKHLSHISKPTPPKPT